MMQQPHVQMWFHYGNMLESRCQCFQHVAVPGHWLHSAQEVRSCPVSSEAFRAPEQPWVKQSMRQTAAVMLSSLRACCSLAMLTRGAIAWQSLHAHIGAAGCVKRTALAVTCHAP
jgi:hypothetical protein